MPPQKNGRTQIWVSPEMVIILEKAEKQWPYRKRVEFVREALADFAKKYDIQWQEVTA